MIIETNFSVNEEKLSYEITDKGYIIYLNNQKWIVQEKYIPHIRDTMEESALAHIEEIVKDNELSNESNISKNEFIEMQQDITDMDLRLIALGG